MSKLSLYLTIFSAVLIHCALAKPMEQQQKLNNVAEDRILFGNNGRGNNQRGFANGLLNGLTNNQQSKLLLALLGAKFGFLNGILNNNNNNNNNNPLGALLG